MATENMRLMPSVTGGGHWEAARSFFDRGCLFYLILQVIKGIECNVDTSNKDCPRVHIGMFLAKLAASGG